MAQLHLLFAIRSHSPLCRLTVLLDRSLRFSKADLPTANMEYEDNYGGGGQQGGFMGEAGTSPSGQSGGKKGRGGRSDYASKTFLPVNVRWLSQAVADANGDSFNLSGCTLNMVKLIGLLTDFEEDSEGKTTIAIEDGSGAITIGYYGDPTSVEWANTRASLGRNKYIEICGPVKTGDGGALSFRAETLRIITDYNAVTHHFLSIIHTYLEVRHGPMQAVPAMAAGALAYGGGGAASSSSNSGGAYGGGGYGGGAVAMGGGGGSGLDQKSETVLAAFRAEGENNDDGASLDVVAARLARVGITRQDIEKVVDMLTTDGLIYSTIDEQHFKTTS